MSTFRQRAIRHLAAIIGTDNIDKMVGFSERVLSVAGISLLDSVYRNRGILKYKTFQVSGEMFFAKNVLPTIMNPKARLIMFDVGANTGDYAALLNKTFPDARVFAFEPNPDTFDVLCSNVKASNTTCFNIGFGKRAATTLLHTYSGNTGSAHASLYEGVFNDLHHRNDIAKMTVEIDTIDAFCQKNGISSIDFLKIDTEGHELQVLEGAAGMIKSEKIGVIQFEFNEMNIVSRVFLRDFYAILSEYWLYRLDTIRLISLGRYNSINEIFRIQNIVAIHKHLPQPAQ